MDGPLAQRGGADYCQEADSGGHVEELFGGGAEHRVQRAGQLATFVGEVVAVPFWELADQAMIAQ